MAKAAQQTNSVAPCLNWRVVFFYAGGAGGMREEERAPQFGRKSLLEPWLMGEKGYIFCLESGYVCNLAFHGLYGTISEPR